MSYKNSLFLNFALVLFLILQTSSNAAYKFLSIPSSPQEAVSFDCSGVSTIPSSECFALVALYNGTNGSSWINHSNWLVTNTPCTWYGVSCVNGHVYDLILYQNKLTGSIPPELGNLKYLSQLSLGTNQLTGSIPPELGNLTNLGNLLLDSNQLTGSIPPQLGNLTNLIGLYLEYNHFAGNIPSELGNLSNLLGLYLDNNQLSSIIPSELGNLAKLQNLALSSNQLTGNIPLQFGNLVSLKELYLDFNQLTGNIPPQFGNLANLQVIFLDGNKLSGNVPSELGNLSKLTNLRLRFNYSLSGPLPLSLTNLKLSYFYFDYTGLCEPQDTTFQGWLASIPNLGRTGTVCALTFSISGQVSDASNKPIPGVTISDGGNRSTTTGADGIYNLSSFLPGTYTLFASLNDYSFTPTSIQVLITIANVENQNFIGTLNPLLDLWVDAVTPIQVVEGADLILGKNTAIKVVIRKAGNGTVNNIPVRINFGNWESHTFYVFEPTNVDSQNKLISDNTIHQLNFSANETEKVIYFFSDALKPTGNSMQVSATIEFKDSNESNNSLTSLVYNVKGTQWSDNKNPQFSNYFFRMDWYNTPTYSFPSTPGKNPETVFNNYINLSSRFLKGLYPVADSDLIASKSDYYVDTRPSRMGFRFDKYTLTLWALENWIGLQVALPTVDRFIAVAPQSWFWTYTADDNGDNLSKAGGFHSPNVPGLVILEARDALQLNQGGQQFVPHEIGHSYGLTEYSTNFPCGDGLWVNEKEVIHSTADKPIYSFMDGIFNWPNPDQVWIDSLNYDYLITHHPITAQLNNVSVPSSSKSIIVSGTADKSGSVELGNWYIVEGGNLSEILPGPYSFEFQDSNGNVLYSQSFDLSFSVNGLPSGEMTQIPFGFVLPYVEGTSRVVIKNGITPLAVKNISGNAPIVNLLSPNGGELINGFQKIEWQASDLDGDQLFYTILFSSDNGVNWFPLAVNLSNTHFNWDTHNLKAGSQYLVKVIATDGFNSGMAISATSFSVMNNWYLPITKK